MQHFHLYQEGGSSVRKWLSTTNRKYSVPRRVAYFLNELRQPVVHTACRPIYNGRVQSLYSLFLVVKRPPGSKVQDFTNRFCFHFSKTSNNHCCFWYCIINTFFLILHTFRLLKSLERLCYSIHPYWTTTCKCWQLQQLFRINLITP